MSHSTRRALSVALVIGALLATAAGRSGGATLRPAAGGYPVTVAGSIGSVKLTSKPTRIISLSPTATDMLFAIGAGKQVVAVDSDSTLPAKAPRTTLSGLDPNVEAIAKYRPDLVVISYDPNGLVAALAKLGIPVLEQDAATSLRNTYSQIAALGRATDHSQQAESEIASIRSTLAAIVAKRPHFATPVTYYYELDQTYYTVTSSTFVGSLLSMLGLKNIADGASGASSGYPQLSAEFILRADPDLIVLADTVCCGQSAKTVAARPGWSAITAVKDDAVLGVNDSIASQWGPNVVQLEAVVEQQLQKLATREHR